MQEIELPTELNEFLTKLQQSAGDIETMVELQDIINVNPTLFSKEECEALDVEIDSRKKQQLEEVNLLQVRLQCWTEHVVNAGKRIKERAALLEKFDKRTGLLNRNDSLMQLFVAGQVCMQKSVEDFARVLTQVSDHEVTKSVTIDTDRPA
jgi:uncharacterized protein (DUF2342 family)